MVKAVSPLKWSTVTRSKNAYKEFAVKDDMQMTSA
jgi:hypothetical protein